MTFLKVKEVFPSTVDQVLNSGIDETSRPRFNTTILSNEQRQY